MHCEACGKYGQFKRCFSWKIRACLNTCRFEDKDEANDNIIFGFVSIVKRDIGGKCGSSEDQVVCCPSAAENQISCVCFQ